MTILLKDSTAQKRYFELGQQEAAAMTGRFNSAQKSDEVWCFTVHEPCLEQIPLVLFQ